MDLKQFSRATFLLPVILVIAFLLRLNGFTHPIADWHSWRQADTSAVSRNFVKYGYDILHPRFDDLSNVASGKDNPYGYRYVEFPIYNVLQAGLSQLLGFFTLEEWGRLITIFSSLASIFFIYALLTRCYGKRIGLLGAFFYAFLPYDIYYGRVILPDPSMVTMSLGAVYFFSRWIDSLPKKKNGRDTGHGQNDEKIFLILAMVCASLAFLLKPYAVFFLLPIPFLAYQTFGMKMLTKWQLWVFAFVAVLPLLWWRNFMTQFPEGIPANKWLLNGNGIRFRPAFFRWMVYERLIKLISGYVGTIFLLFGGIQLIKLKKYLLVWSLVLGSLLYVCIFATGNVQHDYYQILIMPTIAMVYALGADYLLTKISKLSSSYVATGIVIVLSLLTFYFSWQQVKGYFYINNPSIIVAGKAVDHLTPKNAKVVALYMGDTSFLYQTNRQAWPTLENALPDLIKKGATYMVMANPTPDDLKFVAPYKVVSQTKQYILVNLREKR